ncbi:MAG: hypothetical protein P4L41_08700 [Flavipsychrobacter sp.]|nr:hypothetical protein [Flavipsychrobacter sp.]
MNFDNQQFVIFAYSISNIVGLLMLWAAIKRTRLARVLFVLLFTWASWTNYTASHQHPEVYLDYAKFSVGFYKDFINGWFRNHTVEMVTLVSICQALISLGMLLNGTWVRLACIGTIVFLVGIAPLGVGAAFPFSLIVSLAAYFILRNDRKDYLWKNNTGRSLNTLNHEYGSK